MNSLENIAASFQIQEIDNQLYALWNEHGEQNTQQSRLAMIFDRIVNGYEQRLQELDPKELELIKNVVEYMKSDFLDEDSLYNDAQEDMAWEKVPVIEFEKYLSNLPAGDKKNILRTVFNCEMAMMADNVVEC